MIQTAAETSNTTSEDSSMDFSIDHKADANRNDNRYKPPQSPHFPQFHYEWSQPQQTGPCLWAAYYKEGGYALLITKKKVATIDTIYCYLQVIKTSNPYDAILFHIGINDIKTTEADGVSQ